MGSAVKPAIMLVPIGAVPGEVHNWLADALPPILHCACSLAPALPHPTLAWNSRRQQYLADMTLALVTVGHATHALAIADLDLYVPELNFVFGLADWAAARAIIALPRLRQDFYGLPEDMVLFRKRVVKEAVHELGHTFGLGHCRDRRCVMTFSNSLSDTDYKGPGFCPKCQKQAQN